MAKTCVVFDIAVLIDVDLNACCTQSSMAGASRPFSRLYVSGGPGGPLMDAQQFCDGTMKRDAGRDRELPRFDWCAAERGGAKPTLTAILERVLAACRKG
jgi:hypothetical protein